MIKHRSSLSGARKGFTLVELLVSIAIFAVLSALGWKVFDYLVKVKDRNAMHEQNLSQLQDAFLQFQRDALQIVPMTANQSSEIQPALTLSDQILSFSRAGVTDPMQQGLSPFERVQYQYNAQEKKLYRLKYAGLNIHPNRQPLSSVVLDRVDEFQITVLNPAELNRWPDNTIDPQDLEKIRVLPKGIRVQFSVNDVQYEWIFSLLKNDDLEKKD